MNILFEILRLEICGMGSGETLKEKLKDEDLTALWTVAKKHDLAPIVGHCLGKLGLLCDDELGREMKQVPMLAVYRYMQQERALKKACGALETAGIDHVPLKGAVIRKCYPLPWMRTGCDIDILVKEETIEEAAKAMTAAGFTQGKKGSHEISFFSTENAHVELHYTLIEDTVSQAQADVLAGLWEAAQMEEGTSHRYLLPDRFFYFYHMAHMAKHTKLGGCGMKPFVDLWILKNRIEADLPGRQKLLEKGGLTAFAQAAEALMEAWFAGETPEGMAAYLEQYVVEGGVYGTLQQRIVVTQVAAGSKWKYALSKFVIPYEVIKYQYPILEKHRWLTPLYQVRRWCKLLFMGGVKRSLFTLRTSTGQTKEQISSTEELMAYLGL